MEEVGEEVIMGADFVYTHVDIGSDFATFIHDMKFFINNASNDVIDRLVDHIYYDSYEDEDESDMRVVLLNLIEAFDEVKLHARDIGIIYVNDCMVVFTAGWSWGDDPTDSFDIISSVSIIADEMRK